jgi:hypothetical protein
MVQYIGNTPHLQHYKQTKNMNKNFSKRVSSGGDSFNNEEYAVCSDKDKKCKKIFLRVKAREKQQGSQLMTDEEAAMMLYQQQQQPGTVQQPQQ